MFSRILFIAFSVDLTIPYKCSDTDSKFVRFSERCETLATFSRIGVMYCIIFTIFERSRSTLLASVLEFFVIFPRITHSIKFVNPLYKYLESLTIIRFWSNFHKFEWPIIDVL
jgi:hypothetical protein